MQGRESKGMGDKPTLTIKERNNGSEPVCAARG